MFGPSTTRKAFRLAQPAMRASSLKNAGDEPLFVIGSGRSGNTLVRRVLLASEQIYIPPETYVLGDIIESWTRSFSLPWRQRVWLFCAFFERHPHFHTFGIDNLNTFATEAIALPDQNLRALIEAYFRFLAREAGSGAVRWGDKTPWNTNHLAAIGRIFPQARYLWLVRDGRDVALSYVEAGLYNDLSSAAARWVDANRACARFTRWAPHTRLVRYEDIVADPESEFAGIFAWAGLDFAPEMLETRPMRMGDVEALSHHAAVANKISAVSVGKWKSGISEAELADLPDSFRTQCVSLGYNW